MYCYVKPFRNNTLEIMARTSKIEVRSETPVTGLTKSKKIAIDDQLEAVKRLFNVLVTFCVGHLILSVVAATLFGVYISDHVRCSLNVYRSIFKNKKERKTQTKIILYCMYLAEYTIYVQLIKLNLWFYIKTFDTCRLASHD